MGWLTRRRETVVSCCERCGSVCDASCRAEAIRERAWPAAQPYGWRQA